MNLPLAWTANSFGTHDDMCVSVFKTRTERCVYGLLQFVQLDMTQTTRAKRIHCIHRPVPCASMPSQDYVDLHVKPENFRTCKVRKLDVRIAM